LTRGQVAARTTGPYYILADSAQPWNVDTFMLDGRIIKRGGQFTVINTSMLTPSARCGHSETSKFLQILGDEHWDSLEIKMGVFDSCHRDVGVLVDHPGADIMTEEQFADRYSAASIGNSDISADSEVLHRGLDEVFRVWGAVDIDGFGSLIIPSDRHQRTDSCGVIIVMVRDEYRSDISNVESRLRNSARDTVPSVDNIQGAIDDQKIGRLCPVGSRRWPSHGPKSDQTGSRLRRRVGRLRHAFVGHDSSYEEPKA
jgi:hypothetical protein